MAHLTFEQLFKIEAYRNTGTNNSGIADLAGKDKSVISREISRKADQLSGIYKAVLADKKAKARHKSKHKKYTLTAEVEVNILCYLTQDYSPEQIVR